MSKFTSCATRGGVLALCLASLVGCTNMDEMQQRMVSGGAIGLGVGAVGTVVTGGCIPCGAVLGAAVGTGGGYLIDKLDQNTRSSPSSNANYNSTTASPTF